MSGWGGKVACMNWMWPPCTYRKEIILLSCDLINPFFRRPVCKEWLEPSTIWALDILGTAPTKTFLPLWHPRRELVSFLPRPYQLTGKFKHLSFADVLFIGPLHSLKTEFYLLTSRSSPAETWGLRTQAQSCYNMAMHHQASSGCGHSSRSFQPKIFWMECPNY